MGVEGAPAAAELSLWSGPNVVALLTLTMLEIVLGVDNIVFIAILCGRLPEEQRAKARFIGLSLALVTRVLFLLTISYIISLAKADLFPIPFLKESTQGPNGDVVGPSMVSGKDLVLILGGLFLIWKATHEIHAKFGDETDGTKPKSAKASFAGIIAQILVIDIVFSIDSVITAVGMAQRIEVMVAAVVISICVMLAAAGKISSFIDKHPSLKMLALAFLILIGFVLVAEGLGQHISKGYIYFAMAFSLGVETLNIFSRGKTVPKSLSGPVEAQKADVQKS